MITVFYLHSDYRVYVEESIAEMCFIQIFFLGIFYLKHGFL
jgi:hypothetical protein